MFVHHQINNNSGINIIYKQSSTICIAKLLYTIMMLTVITLLAGCNSPAKGVYNDSDYNEAVSTAKTTPFGAYPDTIEYTLGKMTSVNNSNMPAMDTYTDNAYTRYIKSVLNVQNVDVFEANDSQYNTNVSMAVSMNRLPDIMVVSSQSELEQLIENGMIEDLTDSYNNCLTDRIKSMYASYGSALMDMVTYDGKIMALPETNITDGPNLVWLRKDWMDILGLSEPRTVDDVVNCADSEEFDNYYQLNVEPTARPLSINVDYNNALSICYRNISDAIEGRKDSDNLELLERSYYNACKSYLNNTGLANTSYEYNTDDSYKEYSQSGRKGATSTQWAAYMSRIKACRLLDEGNIVIKQSLYFKTTDTMKNRWWKLKSLEKEAYLKIISGEADIDYFDTFVSEWNAQGGIIITEEVRENIVR